MSELKARGVDDVYIEYYNTGKHELAQVYLKSEADKEISDLKRLNHDLCERVTENDEIRQHWEEIEQTKTENARLKAKLAEQDAEIAQLQAMLEERNSQIAKLTQSLEQVKRAARTLRKKMYNEKRKRCLKMAELCCERKENCYNVALRKYTKSEGDKLIKKSERWEEWEDCWIQLADKFKESK